MSDTQKKRMNPLTLVLLLSAGFFVLFLVVSAALFFSGAGSRGTVSTGRFFGGDSVGVVEVDGVIMESKDLLEQIKTFSENPSIKAIVVRINSPGGAVAPSQEVYQALRDLKKPVVSSLGSVAASGGYYIAVGTQKIFANAGTITGSIGVIMQFANLSRLYEWAKIERYSIKPGKFKDIGSEYRSQTPEERALLQEMVDNVLVQFKSAVAEGRRLRMVEVNAVADGRIMTGEQAHRLKLVDEIGGFREAVREAAKLAKIKGEPNVVYPKKPKESLLEFFLNGAQGRLTSSDSVLAKLFREFNAGEPLISLKPGIYWLWEGALP